MAWIAKDIHGNIVGNFYGPINKEFVGTELIDGTVVTSVEEKEDLETNLELSLQDKRRRERKIEFSTTLDLINPVWYNSLTEQEKSDLAEWRQAWLDYPSTGVKPEDLNFIEV